MISLGTRPKPGMNSGSVGEAYYYTTALFSIASMPTKRNHRDIKTCLLTACKARFHTSKPLVVTFATTELYTFLDNDKTVGNKTTVFQLAECIFVGAELKGRQTARGQRTEQKTLFSFL